MENYIKAGKIPPRSKIVMTPSNELAQKLKPLIGTAIPMTGKSKTDGSNFRKIVTKHLLETYMPDASEDYEIEVPKGKGLPKFLRECIDTYIVTTGKNYNLQVWNRNPVSESILVDLKNGEYLRAKDIRFVFGKINPEGYIEAIAILTPEYIENKFGKFGKQTVKQQLIISDKKRNDIIQNGGMVIQDSNLSDELFAEENSTIAEGVSIQDEPDKILSVKAIEKKVKEKLVGEKLDFQLSTKLKGQQLERMVAYLLGYNESAQRNLEGGYPDIRNQMLEVKVQDSPTVDLGRYSPQFEEQIYKNFTTRTIRYLIALTNAASGKIDSLVISPGEELGKHFTYVSEKSFKCQRSIPMSFFDELKGKSVFNP